MGGEFDTILVGLTSGGGGAAAVGSVVWLMLRAWLQGQFAELERLRKADEEAKLARMAAIEKRMGALEEGCVAKHDRLSDWQNRLERIAADLANLVGWMRKVDLKLDRIAEDNAAVKADVEAKKVWLTNLNDAVLQHAADRASHGG